MDSEKEYSDQSASSEEQNESDSDEEYNYKKSRSRRKPDTLNGEYSYKNEIKQRVIGQPCIDCKMHCDTRVAERFRQDNYLNFWGKLKSWEDRRVLVRRLVQVQRVPHPKNKTRKKFLRKYYLEMDDGLTLVCKTMFFSTLAISVKFLETTLQKYPDNVLDESKIKLINSPSILVKSGSTLKSAQKVLKQEAEDQTEKLPLPEEAELLNIDRKEDIKPTCSCTEQCALKVSQEARLKIYDHFWTTMASWEERKLFIINTVEKDRYTCIRTFVLPTKDGDHINVCQEMYLHTLSISEKTIDIILPKGTPLPPPPTKRKSITEYHSQLPQALTSSGQTTIQLIPNSIKPQQLSKDLTKEPLPPLIPIKKKKLEYAPLGPPCSCNMYCKAKVTDDVREHIHREFWNLPAQVDQKHFILSTIQTQVNKDKVSKEKTLEIKQFMLPCLYDTMAVCKEMYLHTLAISEEFVSRTIKNINRDGSIIEDEEEETTKEGGSAQGIALDKLEPQIKEDASKGEVIKKRKLRTSKKMGPPCPSTCRLKCNAKFKEEERRNLHDKFWCNDWQGKKQFIISTVREFPIKNRSVPGRLTKRNFSRIYTLPSKDKKITVCQKMYFNTLSICSKFVSTVHIWASQVKW